MVTSSCTSGKIDLGSSVQVAEKLMDLYFVEGSYYYEGPLNVPEKHYIHNKRPVTVGVILAHIMGKKSICAPSCHNGLSKWITLDIDSDDINSLTMARDIITSKGYPVYMSYSGGKGYHLTIYLGEPTVLSSVQKVTAEIQTSLNRLAIPVCKISPSPHGNGGDGMKLPLGIHPETGNYCYFVDRDLNPVNDSLTHLLAVQTIEVNGHKKCEFNPITGEIPLEFPGEISNRPCVNKVWQYGVHRESTRHSATCVITNAIAKNHSIPRHNKKAVVAKWVDSTYPKAKDLIKSSYEFAMSEAMRLMDYYMFHGTRAENCTNQVFKAAMRSACEDEFSCKIKLNHGYINFPLLMKLDIFSAPNAKPPGLGKSAMVTYLTISDVIADEFQAFQWNGLKAFSLSIQQLIDLARCCKSTAIRHRKLFLKTGLLLKIPEKDIPPDVWANTPRYYRSNFYALSDITGESTVREIFKRLRGV
jgi:hypothetical protein